MAYVYRHIRLDQNIPFYIGIGSDSLYKRSKDKRRRGTYWNGIVNKHGFIAQIVIDDLTWEQACEKEKEFIKLYGRLDKKEGTLVNHTDGGEGALGHIMSEEQKEKISKSNKGKIRSEEARRKYAEVGRTRINSEERNRKHSETLKRQYASGEKIAPLKDRVFSDEHKQRISESKKGQIRNIGRIISEETRIKMSLASKGRILSEEHKRKISLSNIGKHKVGRKQSIEERLKRSIKVKLWWAERRNKNIEVN